MFAIGSTIKNQKSNKIKNGIKQVKKLCLQRDYKITHIHADSEFEPLLIDMSDLDISLNCAFKKEHTPKIERFNRTIKERVCSDQTSMPLKIIYKLMIIHLVANENFG